MTNKESLLPSPIERHLGRLMLGGGKIVSITVKHRSVPNIIWIHNDERKKENESNTNHSTTRNASPDIKTSTSNSKCSGRDASYRHGQRNSSKKCKKGSRKSETIVRPRLFSPSPPSCFRSKCDLSRHKSHRSSSRMESSRTGRPPHRSSNSHKSPSREISYPDMKSSDDLNTDQPFPPSIVHQKKATDNRSTSYASSTSTMPTTGLIAPYLTDESDVPVASSCASMAKLRVRGNHSCLQGRRPRGDMSCDIIHGSTFRQEAKKKGHRRALDE